MSTLTAPHVDAPKAHRKSVTLHYVNKAYIDSGDTTARPLCGIRPNGTAPVSPPSGGDRHAILCPDCLLVYVQLPKREGRK